MSLQTLLDQGAQFDAEYDGALSNHLPMALVALQRLGAGTERLQAFAAAYSRRLQAAPPPEPWPAGDAWAGRFGQREAWPAYRSLFTQWLQYEDPATMLAQALPRLMPGCGAAAFHGLIRTAYALQAGHAGELADALAYWACRYLPLGEWGDAPAEVAEPVALLRQLRAGRSRAGMVFERMRDAARGGAVNRVAARLCVDERTPERLARGAALAYAGSGNFTALHLLTASHAMHVVAASIDEPLPAWRWFWQAFAHAVVAAGMRASAPPALQGWDQIVSTAIESEDDHVIKLIDSCRELHRCYGGDDWRRAASRALMPSSA